jgi:hypothetical protein
MPGQFFVDEHCRQVVLIRWDMGVKFIDIEFAGARLARLEGPDILLSTGMQGAAPDGNHLVVGATRESGPITFYVQYAGVYLTPEPVDYAMHPPVVEIIDALNSTGRAGASQAGLSMDSKGRLVKDGLVVDDTVLTYAAGARKVDHGAITKGRIWIGIVAGLSLPFVALIAFFASLGSVFLIASPDLTMAEKAKLIGAVVYVVALLIVLVLALVFSFKKIPSFGPAKLAMVLCLIGSPIIGWAIMYFGLKALGNAQDQAESLAYNADREAHLANVGHRTL